MELQEPERLWKVVVTDTARAFYEFLSNRDLLLSSREQVKSVFSVWREKRPQKCPSFSETLFSMSRLKLCRVEDGQVL